MIHLFQNLQNSYITKVEWSVILFGGNTFDWKYHDRYFGVSMPGYVQRLLQKFHCQPPKLPQLSPFFAAPYVKAIKGQRQYAPK